MNQILTVKENIQNKEPKNFSNYSKYKLQFILSSIVAIIFIILFLFRLYVLKKNEELSKQLLNSFNVTTLYSANYIAENITRENNITPFVIGILKINKINLNYPILSNSSKELLDVSVCRFAGPMPNEVGNLCIAGHNYVDYRFFSRLFELEIDDKIEVYDLSGNKINYIIYNKYEVSNTDTSCTLQNTNGDKIVTLLTCNNVTGNRLILKAKEKTEVKP